MTQDTNRRHFLQTSLAAGAILSMSTNTSQGDVRSGAPFAAMANPTVRPGRVRWHADLAAASAASRNSGTPVFLFQMLGRLDERFC